MAVRNLPRRRPGRPKSDEGLDTKKRLLDAALGLFARQGYAATTTRQIARKVGVSDAAIYSHFSSKKEIYDTLLAASGPPLLTDQGYGLDDMRVLGPAKALPVVFERLVSAWDRPHARLFTSVLLRESSADVAKALDEVRRLLRPVIQDWVDTGRLRGDVDVDLLTWELIAPLATIRLAMLNHSSSPTDREMGRALAKRHVDYFLLTSRPG